MQRNLRIKPLLGWCSLVLSLRIREQHRIVRVKRGEISLALLLHHLALLFVRVLLAHDDDCVDDEADGEGGGEGGLDNNEGDASDGFGVGCDAHLVHEDDEADDRENAHAADDDVEDVAGFGVVGAGPEEEHQQTHFAPQLPD